MSGSLGTVGLYAALVAALSVLVWPVRRRPGVADHARSRPNSPPARRGDQGSSGLTLEDVATTLTMLSLAVRGGAPMVEALERVAQVSPDPARGHIATVAAAMQWGLSARDAWAAVPAVWAPAGRALTLAVRAGVPPARLLADAATQVRADDMAHADEAAARLGVRLVLPLGLAFLPAFGLTTVVPIVVAIASELLSG